MLVLRGLYITSWILILLKGATGTDKLSNKSALDRNKKWIVLPNVPRPGNPPAAPIEATTTEATTTEATTTTEAAECTAAPVAGCPMGASPDNCMAGESEDYCSANDGTCLWPTSTEMGCTLLDGMVDCMCAPQCAIILGCPVNPTGSDQVCMDDSGARTCPVDGGGMTRVNCYWPADTPGCAKAPVDTTRDCDCENA